jgi:hypothetical protein
MHGKAILSERINLLEKRKFAVAETRTYCTFQLANQKYCRFNIFLRGRGKKTSMSKGIYVINLSNEIQPNNYFQNYLRNEILNIVQDGWNE